MKNKNVTFSLPIELIACLQRAAGKGGISQFVAEAVKKAIEGKKEALKAEYAEDNEDAAVQETIKDWAVTEGEGWDE